MRKKSLLTVILLCLLCIGCMTFTACDNIKSGYKITLDYDSKQGNVVVSAPKDGKLYLNGENVEVSVIPEEGYEIDLFKVTGYDDAGLTDGKYSFVIKSDTTVTVTFKKKVFTVDLSTSEEGGGATLEPEKDKYEYGENVTLMVTPNDGYLAEVKINGEEAELRNNSLGFTVESNTIIEVVFKLRVVSVLDSLCGSIIFEGVRTEKDYLNKVDNLSEIKTTFDEKEKAVLIESYENGEPIRVWLFKETDDGKTEQLTHNMAGKLLRENYDHPFETLFNPFDLLTTKDIENVEGNKWTVKDEDKLGNVIDALLGYKDICENFAMYEENGKIVRIEFSFKRVVDDYGWEDHQYFYVLEVKQRGTAAIDAEYFTDYKMTAEHDELKKVLENAAEAESYIVNVKIGEDNNYTLYYTNDGIYIDEATAERGYTVRPDGNVWSFTYDPQNKLFDFGEIVKTSANLDFLKGIFTLSDNNGEYYLLLKSLGDGKFAARAADIYDSYGEVSIFFAQQMATGSEQVDMFYSAVSFALSIKEGKLRQVEMDLSDIGHVTLSFDKWNEAILPIAITTEALKGKIDSAYCGSWADENGNTVMQIDLDKIRIGNIDDDAMNMAEELTALADGGYSFTVDGITYTVKLSGTNLILNGNNESTTFYKCPWFKYIGDFLGVDNDGKDVDVTIAANGIQILIEGDQVKSATEIVFEQIYVVDEYNYVERVDQFTFKIDGKEYILQQYGYGYDALVFAPSGSQNGIGLNRDKYKEFDDWTDYMGTYSGEGYKLVIEADKLKITDTEGETVIDQDIIFYRDWDYQNNQYYYQFSFTYKGHKCILQLMENAMFFVIDSDKTDYKSYYLMDENYKIDYSDFYGIYTGTGYDGTVYKVEVCEDGVFITIGSGERKKVQIVYFIISEIYGNQFGGSFIFKLDGKTYYLTTWTSMGSGNLQFDNEYIFLTLVEE